MDEDTRLRLERIRKQLQDVRDEAEDLPMNEECDALVCQIETALESAKKEENRK